MGMTLHILRARTLCLLAACLLVLSADAQTNSVAVDSVQVDTLRLAVLLPFGLQVDTWRHASSQDRPPPSNCDVMFARGGSGRVSVGSSVPVEVQVLDETPDSLGRPQYSLATSAAPTWSWGR